MACRSSELLSKHVERILDALPEGVFISDAAGTSLQVNRMYEQLTGLTQEQILRNAKKKLPMRRFIQSEEVAAMVRYLASPEAGGVTAQSLVIDGGVGLGM